MSSRHEWMTPLERWLAVLRGQKPDRVPLDYWATDEATTKLMAHLGCSDREALFARLHIDGPMGLWPHYVGPRPAPGENEYGCRFAPIAYDGGMYSECVFHPLAAYNTIDEIERNYRWPSPDWYDYSYIPALLQGVGQRPIRGGGSEPFLTYCELRGQERAYADLLENPELVEYCLDKLFDLAYTNTQRIYEAARGRVTFSYIAEDFGAQNQLLFSPAIIRRIFIPRMKRMMDLARQAGVYVFFHSDGAIRPILPDMIEAGVQILNPVQWRCAGMEREGLKRDFGDNLVFHGGMDNQQTLVFGSIDDVRREAVENLAILGAGGGYIFAPCHNIQAVTAPENVVAMYETAYNEGWY